MKKFLIVFFILLFNISLWGQKVSIAPNTLFHVPETMSLILSDAVDLNNDSESSTFNGNIKFIGSEEQIISGTVPVNISNMYIDNTGILLENDVFIISEIEMQNGIINLQSNNLTIGSDAILSGNYSNECMLVSDANGIFIRNVSGNGIYFFPLGDITENPDYSPAEIDITNGNFTDANVSISVINAKHPNNSSNDNYLNRYWQVLANGITSPEYDITLDYVAGDIVGSESEIYGALYADEWVLLNQVSGNQITGTVTEFGDFTGGEQSAFTGINNVQNNEINIIGLNDGFKININSDIEILQIDVYNVLGQEIYKQKEVTSRIIQFDNNVNTGIYFVRLRTDKGTVSEKVLIY